MNTRQTDARRAGILYLAFIITTILGGAIRGNLLILGNASKTAEHLKNNEWLLRICMVDELVAAVLFLLAAWALYVLLKPVHKNLALLFLLLNAAGVAVQCMSLLNLVVPMLISGGADFSKSFSPAQLDALSLLFLNLHKSGFTIAQIFYGTWLFPLGLLVYKSGFLPKWLGILLMADCVGVLIWFFQFFLLPDFAIITYPGLAVSFCAEFSLTFWLIIKRVKDQAPVCLDGG
jgi:hypothetical protein